MRTAISRLTTTTVATPKRAGRIALETMHFGVELGRYNNLPNGTHNDLLVSVLNYRGLDQYEAFGEPEAGNGPLLG